MAVDTIKSKYAEHQKQVQIVNDVYNGVDSCTQYLRKYEALETESEFKTRQADATLTSFVYDSIDSIENIIFRKSVNTDGVKNAKMLGFMDSIDLSNNINDFAIQVLRNARLDGFTFLRDDATVFDENEVKSERDTDLVNARPYLVNIRRSSVTHWQGSDINFSDWVILEESVIVDGTNFEEEVQTQHRVLYANGKIELYKKDATTPEIIKEATSVITKPILIKVGNKDVPELYDQAKTNIKHFNAESERRLYSRKMNMPIFGVGARDWQTKDAPNVLGLGNGFKFGTHEYKMGWASPDAVADEVTEKNLISYEKAMRMQTLEFLTKDSNLTATQVNKESAPKEAKLSFYAVETQEGINKAIARMNNRDKVGFGENTISINKDFDNNKMEIADAIALAQLKETTNALTFDEFRDILEEGELLRPTNKEERDNLKLLIRDDD